MPVALQKNGAQLTAKAKYKIIRIIVGMRNCMVNHLFSETDDPVPLFGSVFSVINK